MGAIVLENNCFIGARAVLLGGTHIGENSIIAAGAVVHGNIPSNEVWGGVPAKFIMSVDSYAKKVKDTAEKLPWMNGNMEMKNQEALNEARKKYYLSLFNKDTDQ